MIRNNNIGKPFLLILSLGVFSLYACSSPSKSSSEEETNTSGNIEMLVDESLAPIVNEELAVYQSDYHQANIQFKFGNEVDVVNSLVNDSIRYKSAILARDLTKNEIAFFASKKRKPQVRTFAIDGIALIVNTQSSIDEIGEKDLLNSIKSGHLKYPLVFDNGGSSTISYLKNKAGVDKLPKNGIFVLQGYQSVVKYVQANKDYIGVVGLNWLIKNDTTELAVPKDVKLLAVKDSTGAAYQPNQQNLMAGKYPLRRPLFIVNLKYGYGLGIGFASWLCSDRGQLLVLKSGLAPMVEPSRELRFINKSLNIK